MEDVLITHEDGVFYVDITDAPQEERLIIRAKKKEDFIDLMFEEIDYHRAEREACLGNVDIPGWEYHTGWIRMMFDVMKVISSIENG